MKKGMIIAVVLISVILLSSFASAFAPVDWIKGLFGGGKVTGKVTEMPPTLGRVYGDVNQNGVFDMADLNMMTDILLMRIAAPSPGTESFIVADVNGDGKLDLTDQNLIVDKLLGRISTFPVETPKVTATCSDTDGGVKYDEVGKVSGVDSSGNAYTYSDFCQNTVSESSLGLTEYSCSNNAYTSEYYVCAYGCSAGACKQAPSTSCTDTDGGVNYFVQGNITGPLVSDSSGLRADICIGDSLREMFCNSLGQGEPRLYSCPIGCENGTCKHIDVLIEHDLSNAFGTLTYSNSDALLNNCELMELEGTADPHTCDDFKAEYSSPIGGLSGAAVLVEVRRDSFDAQQTILNMAKFYENSDAKFSGEWLTIDGNVAYSMISADKQNLLLLWVSSNKVVAIVIEDWDSQILNDDVFAALSESYLKLLPSTLRLITDRCSELSMSLINNMTTLKNSLIASPLYSFVNVEGTPVGENDYVAVYSPYGMKTEIFRVDRIDTALLRLRLRNYLTGEVRETSLDNNLQGVMSTLGGTYVYLAVNNSNPDKPAVKITWGEGASYGAVGDETTLLCQTVKSSCSGDTCTIYEHSDATFDYNGVNYTIRPRGIIQDGSTKKIMLEINGNILELGEGTNALLQDGVSRIYVNIIAYSTVVGFDNYARINFAPTYVNSNKPTTTMTEIQALAACSGCFYKNACYSVGQRFAGAYCNAEKNAVNQMADNSACANNYECSSESCISNKCAGLSVSGRIAKWFRNLFGFQ